ncbi:hypothetical protein LTR09_009639 [Extremus antarcticus]|uniref:UBX domain-containing protein n=1 Tax=Extremus antarcticus TaxID=702011 RepID=A0AAJ0DEY9_9PEZI|nr:hypothetical protein LTR09_009639 [Extremus antarcticus]
MDDSDDAASLFHTGSLASGVSLAIAQSKVVACFVHSPSPSDSPGSHASHVWEHYWLANKSQPTDMISSDTPPLGLLLGEKAVLLKMEFGTKEAGFLKAFVDIESAPTMVVIDKGKVVEMVEGSVGREEFTERLLRAVGFGVGGGEREAEGEGGREEEDEEMVDDIGGRQIGGAARADEPVVEQAPQEQPTQSSAEVQAMLADRGKRLEAERLRREATEKAERIARANARRKEEEDAVAGTYAGKGKQRATSDQKDKQQARDAWIYQQKQRKDEAKKERERILAQIESDKQERKAQAQRRKDLEAASGAGALSDLPPTAHTNAPPTMNAHTTCALQIRLFDGSSIRGKFDPNADIATAVRIWVKEASPEGGADIPFTFRQILAPNPSRTIEVSEEQQSLLELGLVPSATLVLVPIAGATSAYASNNSGYVNSIYGTASWAASGVFGLLGSVWSYVPSVGSGASGPYIGGTGDEQERSNAEGARMAGSDSAPAGGAVKRAQGRVKRGREEDVTTFYNGNSSAFEGRKDDDGDGEKDGK